MQRLDQDDEDFGEGFIAESHPLRPTHLSLPMGGRGDSRAPSISSSVSDLDVPIYTRDTTVPVTGSQSKEDGEENPSTPTALTRSVPKGLNGRLLFAIAAAVFGSAFQHGYNTGVLNAPQTFITQWMTEIKENRTESITERADESITLIWSITASIFCVGGMIGGSLIGTVADRFGRKGGLLLINVFVVITVIFEGFAKMASSYEMLIIGRFFIGINAGLNAGLAPMYLAEISPIHLRGAVGTVYQLVITISIVIAQILGLEKILGTAEQWPLLLSLTIVPAILQLITLPFCPESPKYLLVTRGKDIDAQRALSWLRGTSGVHDEMEEMRAEYESIKLLPKVSLRELFVNPTLRIPLIIAVMVMIAQQFSGINAVIFFSTEIFKLARLDISESQLASIGVGAMNVVMTVISLVLVEKAGRKTLLLFGFSGMVVVSSLLTVSLAYAAAARPVAHLSIVLVILFVVLFATGPGSIPWFLVSELFDQSARPSATSVAITVNWAANFLVTVSFLSIQQKIGAYVFIIFALLQALFVLFIWKKVPETKNKTIEEITSMFRQRTYQ